MNISKEIESIKNELQIINSFLRDVENKEEKNDSKKAWVNQVRNLGFLIEDTIDEYDLVNNSELYNNQPWLGFLLKIFPCLKEFMSHDNILVNSIANIKREILRIREMKSLYNLHVVEQHNSGMNDPSVRLQYPLDSDLVGIEVAQNEIMELLDLDMKDSMCSIISIVGMGGIGKTTLTRNIYENIEVKRHFHVHAWISVTQFYCRKDIFLSMLHGFYNSAMESLPIHVAQMDEMSLVDQLREFLQDKRYLIVFDDVWESDQWNHVKNALPSNCNGSKILLTTRLENVALAWKGSCTNNFLYKLKFLPPNKASELFLKKAFQDSGYPKWCEEISHSIVDKCGGLPLALVTMGSIFSIKDKVLSEWSKFHDSINSVLEQNQQLCNVSRILMLSYNNLPHYLKPCLIYFGMFPKGSSIECNRLIKLWIAEDFIREKKGVTLEDVAKEYLHDLIRRSLVLISTRFDCGRLRTVRVHDLLHDILRQKLRDINFGQVVTKENPKVDVGSRRLGVQEGRFEYVAKMGNSNSTRKYKTRSFLVFKTEGEICENWTRSLLVKSYLLKVLDLQSAPIEAIPKEIGDIYLLRYLSLRFTKVANIPKTIGNLKNLLTLDLKRCPITELPIEVSTLQKLRHLIVYQNTWNNTLKVWEIRGLKVPKGSLLGCSKSLQKLADVNIATSPGFIDVLGDYRMLKYLAISNVKRENSWILCKAIENLNFLESLNITVDYESHHPLELNYINSPPLTLERLYLIGPLDNFPHWIKRLDSLKKLRFRGSKLGDFPLDALQELPNLTMLGINKDVYYGERLVFKEGGFKKLKAMYFNCLNNLNLVEVQNGSLPLLEDLNISRCPELKEVPFGLQHLRKLTSLRIVEMPEEFVSSLSSHSHITNHIADIRVGYQIVSGHHVLKKL